MKRAFWLCVVLLAAATATAQSDETAANPPQPPIHALEFGTYELGWVRFKNIDSDGERKLDADKGITFPFTRINNGTTRLRLEDMDAETIADLIETHDIAYDEDRIAGQCDPNKLPGARADLFCIPGTSGMQQGQICLAIFDRETGALLALTESIDNKAGGALRDWSPTPEAAENQAPAAVAGCGPYADGQWIKAADYDASGLDLTVRWEGHDKNKVTDYVCVVADGEAYLLAYNLSEVGSAGRRKMQSDSGSAESSCIWTNFRYYEYIDGKHSDCTCSRWNHCLGRCLSGPGYDCSPRTGPCTDPFGCDIGDGDE